MRLTIGGVEYRVAVQWYHGGGYHAAPPADGRVAARYRVFLPPDFEERGWFRSYLLRDEEPDDADDAALQRQFGAAAHASSHRSDPNRRMVW